MNGRRSNRTPLYSHSSRARSPVPGPATPPDVAAPPSVPGASPPAARAAQPASSAPPPTAPRARSRLVLPAWAWALAGALLVGGPLAAWMGTRPQAPVITQKHIDAAVLKALKKQPLPSAAAQAYDKVRGSVVRVVGLGSEAAGAHGVVPKPGKAARAPKSAKPTTATENASPDDDPDEVGVGSGVVIVDSGLILTNLHVVSGASRVKVVFHDGLESEASVVNVMPENDLAVLRAERIPDDLQAATLRSTADLKPGDHVTAIGFPFGIGPSVSSGVVSGLKREFRSPEGKQSLSNLIQFDAMANPGSSGGPLVTDEGEVVGIVTAILNPVQQRFFVGIGFAVPIENAAGGAGLPPF